MLFASVRRSQTALNEVEPVHPRDHATMWGG